MIFLWSSFHSMCFNATNLVNHDISLFSWDLRGFLFSSSQNCRFSLSLSLSLSLCNIVLLQVNGVYLLLVIYCGLGVYWPGNTRHTLCPKALWVNWNLLLVISQYWRHIGWGHQLTPPPPKLNASKYACLGRGRISFRNTFSVPFDIKSCL